MALVLKQIFTSGSDQISQNYTIESWHVSQSVDAFTGTKAYDITLSGSFTLTGSQQVTGSISASFGANTVGFFGTSSWSVTSSQAISASSTVSSSYSISSSYATSASYAISSSYATSASYAISSSRAVSSSYAISSSVAVSSSVAISSSIALSSSYASNGVTTLSVGTWYDTTTQTVSTGASASISLDTPVINDGITVVASSRITVTKTGIYNLQFSAQTASNQNGTIYIWLRKNGTNIPYTNTGVHQQNGNVKGIAAWNFVESLNASDFLELIWYFDGNPGQTASLIAEPLSPSNGGVAIPSVIVTMTQIK
jgi:hypothetical protein